MFEIIIFWGWFSGNKKLERKKKKKKKVEKRLGWGWGGVVGSGK